jgi:osmotically inducible protein OsmC
MPILSTISGTTVGGRDGHGETSDKLIQADFKSKGGGPTPEHFFALGYSACFGSALGGVARLEKSEAEELVKAADQMCPYSKAIRNNVPVKLTVL